MTAIKCEYMYGSGMDRLRTDCNNWKSPVWTCPYAETGEFYKCEFRKLPTNADRIRSMTDEALAEGFAKLTDPTKIPMYNGKDMRGNADVFLEWLQQEATP